MCRSQLPVEGESSCNANNVNTGVSETQLRVLYYNARSLLLKILSYNNQKDIFLTLLDLSHLVKMVTLCDEHEHREHLIIQNTN